LEASIRKLEERGTDWGSLRSDATEIGSEINRLRQCSFGGEFSHSALARVIGRDILAYSTVASLQYAMRGTLTTSTFSQSTSRMSIRPCLPT
jgi:hypothetical protein